MENGRSEPLRRWARHLRCIAVTSESPELQVTLGSLARELEKAQRRRPVRTTRPAPATRSAEAELPEA